MARRPKAEKTTTDEVPDRVEADPLDNTEGGVKPWHRQPEETPAAFTAFMCFRGLEPGKRSQKAVTDLLYPNCKRMVREGQTTGYSSHVGEWYRENRWSERARLADVWRDEQAELAEVEALRADAIRRMARERELRTNRDALAEMLHRRLMAMASSVEADGAPALLDGSQAKALREITVAAERAKLVSDGGRAGLEKIIDATAAKALPKAADGDLPTSVPADVAAGILALLATVGEQ